MYTSSLFSLLRFPRLILLAINQHLIYQLKTRSGSLVFFSQSHLHRCAHPANGTDRYGYQHGRRGGSSPLQNQKPNPKPKPAKTKEWQPTEQSSPGAGSQWLVPFRINCRLSGSDIPISSQPRRIPIRQSPFALPERRQCGARRHDLDSYSVCSVVG